MKQGRIFPFSLNRPAGSIQSLSCDVRLLSVCWEIACNFSYVFFCQRVSLAVVDLNLVTWKIGNLETSETQKLRSIGNSETQKLWNSCSTVSDFFLPFSSLLTDLECFQPFSNVFLTNSYNLIFFIQIFQLFCIGATICNRREFQCLLCSGFLKRKTVKAPLFICIS